MESINVEIEGTRPLLMHSIPSEFGAKGRSGELGTPQEEAEKALYRDGNGTIGVPSINVISTIRKAATDFRVPGKGKKTYKDYVYSGLLVEPDFLPLVIPDGSDPSKAWEVDLRPVVVQRARIIRARPRFDTWRLGFTLNVLDPIIRAETLKDMIQSAGKYIGLCDHRPLFGLFKVIRFGNEH